LFQVNPKAILNPQVGYTVTTMAANLLSQVDPDRLIRVTIDNGDGEAGSVDKAIGRAAHICYLDNPCIPDALIHILYALFKVN
jgi:hypothetical protein